MKKCENCGTYVPSKSFARHFKCCSNTPAPKCTQCDYTTHYSWHMKDHVKAVHGKEFSCSDCGKKFSCKKKLEDHEALHRGEHKCDQCPEVFKSVWAKYRHKMRKHTERKGLSSTPMWVSSVSTQSQYLLSRGGISQSIIVRSVTTGVTTRVTTTSMSRCIHVRPRRGKERQTKFTNV